MIKVRRPTHKYDRDPPEVKERTIYTKDFYLHMTQYCVISDNTLLLVFQLDSSHTHIEDDALVVCYYDDYLLMSPATCDEVSQAHTQGEFSGCKQTTLLKKGHNLLTSSDGDDGKGIYWYTTLFGKIKIL